MQSELIVECHGCKARISKDTIMEFLADVSDFLGNGAIETVFEYLEDGSIGILVVDKGVIYANYLSGESTVRVSIYYRRPFSIPELDDRLNFYFIPSEIRTIFKEMM
jgi:hypothetical protein